MRDVNVVSPPGSPPRRPPQERHPRRMGQPSEEPEVDSPAVEESPAPTGEEERVGRIDVRV